MSLAGHPKSHRDLSRKKTIRVIGFDVGKENPAWAVADVKKTGSKLAAFSIAGAKITNFNPYSELPKKRTGISSVKPFSTQVKKFNAQTDYLIEEYQPDFFVIERFQNRGFGKTGGQSSEFCSVIVGALSSRLASLNVPFMLIMAGTWKNQFNSAAAESSGLKDENAKPLERLYSMTSSPHITDAALMAIYAGMKLKGDTPYKHFRLEWIKEILK